MKLKSFLTSLCAAVALTGFAGMASAQECSVDVDSTDAMQFDTDVVVIDSNCKEFTINLTHSGQLGRNVMGHNVVITEADDVQAVANDGIQAGLENNYVKPNDDRVIAHTEIIGGGEETSVTFSVDKLNADTVYTFFCSFPGHSAVMRGTLNIK